MADVPLWLQVLGPIATIAAAGSASYVAWRIGKAQVRINDAQREIAASQRNIAKRRVQMDLHAKRFDILLAARDLMGEAMRNNPDSREVNNLRRTLMQCRFFFPAHVVEIAEQIDAACAELSVLAKVINPRPDLLEKFHEKQMQVADHISRWPAPFSEVMTFRDVE